MSASEERLSEDLYALSEMLGKRAPDEQSHGFFGGEWGYGQDFANDVFEMFPYSWGDCDCRHEDAEAAWCATHQHRQRCYQTERLRRFIQAGVARDWELEVAPDYAKALGEMFDVEREDAEPGIVVVSMTPKPTREDDSDLRNEIELRLCQSMGLTYPTGCAVHCTCNYSAEWNAWTEQNDHAPRCIVQRPNFAHFASGLEVRWYKYIGRGMETNRDVSRQEWRRIISECEESIEPAPLVEGDKQP